MASPSLASCAPIPIPAGYKEIGGLKVHPVLDKTVEDIICPGTGCSPEYFWSCLERITDELRPELERLLARRDEMQSKVDSFYTELRNKGADPADMQHRPTCRTFLKEIGYLEPDQGPVSVNTQFVDVEIASTAAPQLVCPSDNARFVLNAVNSRWGSLYDALYGFDVIPKMAITQDSFGSGFDVTPKKEGAKPGYNPVRGEAVVEFANGLLDEIAPLAASTWGEVTRLWPKFVGEKQQLQLLLKSGETTSLRNPSVFAGSQGSLGPADGMPSTAAPLAPDFGRIFLKHNGLHLILEVDRSDPIGQSASSGIKDITMESALTAILDMEDSVSAVDAEDKCKVYCNINGVFRGNLSAPFTKDGKAMTRTLGGDIWYRDERGMASMLPGRCIALVRNVGHHMFSDAVFTKDCKLVPEGFLDCAITVVSALHDLRGTAASHNSRTGSVYIVKPKQHGSQEVALTARLFGRMEEAFGLRRNTIKMGIMDEERRTSVNLRECIRQAQERVFFINTGFLDRTGDEIHTCLLAGPVVKKADIRKEPWIKAYEDYNVDVGLFSGLQGRGQIGKGMWAKPDDMKAMLEAKISEMMAGASTAWVPSPAAGTLHAIHYHRVDVPARQMQLAIRPPAKVETILEPPLLRTKLSDEDILHELRDNAQSILGYVVRWVDLGVGCSKVPDLGNVALMEDRATLRISSQLLANWLHHGLVSESEIRKVFEEMAKVVDQQNSRDGSYRPMAADFEHNIAYNASLKLVLGGHNAPNGYTEYTLHDARRQVKSTVMSRL